MELRTEFEYKPGRANIIARSKGNGSKRPIMLLSHMDVVTADASAWRDDPFSSRDYRRLDLWSQRARHEE